MRLTATFFNLEALVRTFQHDAVRYTRYPVSACLFLSLGQHGCSFLSGGSFTDLGYFNVQLIRLLDLAQTNYTMDLVNYVPTFTHLISHG